MLPQILFGQKFAKTAIVSGGNKRGRDDEELCSAVVRVSLQPSEDTRRPWHSAER